MLKPSEFHHNKGAHNWLAYDVLDTALESHQIYFRGELIDLGCGTAPYKNYFLQSCRTYIGVDWRPGDGVDHVADLNQSISLEGEIADSIVSLSVLEHLYEPQMMINEAFRLLRPNGHFVLQVPWQWWIHEAPHDYYRFTPYALRKMLQHAGFSEIKIKPQCGYFSAAALKFNYFSRRATVGKTLMACFFRVTLPLIWHVNQWLAKKLDRFDKNWGLETIGYVVVAEKK